MTFPIEELVEQLAQTAQIAIDEYLELPEQLEELMALRQSLLTAIQDSDLSELSPELRARLKLRLQSVFERDQALLRQLEELRSEAQKGMEQLNSGRAAARGYGESMDSSRPGVRRIG